MTLLFDCPLRTVAELNPELMKLSKYKIAEIIRDYGDALDYYRNAIQIARKNSPDSRLARLVSQDLYKKIYKVQQTIDIYQQRKFELMVEFAAYINARKDKGEKL